MATCSPEVVSLAELGVQNDGKHEYRRPFILFYIALYLPDHPVDKIGGKCMETKRQVSETFDSGDTELTHKRLDPFHV